MSGKLRKMVRMTKKRKIIVENDKDDRKAENRGGRLVKKSPKETGRFLYARCLWFKLTSSQPTGILIYERAFAKEILRKIFPSELVLLRL